jgi:hypothetical protein
MTRSNSNRSTGRKPPPSPRPLPLQSRRPHPSDSPRSQTPSVDEIDKLWFKLQKAIQPNFTPPSPPVRGRQRYCHFHHMSLIRPSDGSQPRRKVSAPPHFKVSVSYAQRCVLVGWSVCWFKLGQGLKPSCSCRKQKTAWTDKQLIQCGANSFMTSLRNIFLTSELIEVTSQRSFYLHDYQIG